MHTLKTIFRTCDCGNMNQVYNAYTVHKRFQSCPVCGKFTIKRSNSQRKMEMIGKYDWMEFEFEEFAIAWG